MADPRANFGPIGVVMRLYLPDQGAGGGEMGGVFVFMVTPNPCPTFRGLARSTSCKEITGT